MYTGRRFDDNQFINGMLVSQSVPQSVTQSTFARAAEERSTLKSRMARKSYVNNNVY